MLGGAAPLSAPVEGAPLLAIALSSMFKWIALSRGRQSEGGLLLYRAHANG